MPGNKPRHCTKPIFKASSAVMLSTSRTRARDSRNSRRLSRSAHKMMIAPTIDAAATPYALNNTALIVLLSNKPRAATGRKAMNKFTKKRCPSPGRKTLLNAEKKRSRYAHTTAKMAPIWMAISNTLPRSSCAPSNELATIKCPVLEIGKNSVRPSTTPRMAASIRFNS